MEELTKGFIFFTLPKKGDHTFTRETVVTKKKMGLLTEVSNPVAEDENYCFEMKNILIKQ